MFEKPAEIEFVPYSPKIKLVSDLIYCCKRYEKTFVAERGFICDGASIPRIFWTVMGHPFDYRWRSASILHDWFYRRGGVTRKQADKIFYDGLRYKGVRKTKAWAMYLAVRVGGFFAWRK